MKLGDGVENGPLNKITAHPGYQALDADAGYLIMENGSFTTSRHYFDFSGVVWMGELSAFCGQGTTLLTHKIDMSTNEQTADASLSVSVPQC
jgi:hypothetical protein